MTYIMASQHDEHISGLRDDHIITAFSGVHNSQVRQIDESDGEQRTSLPTSQLANEDVPLKFRLIDKFIMCLGILTFRIFVPRVSFARPGQLVDVTNQMDTKVGTGSIITDPTVDTLGPGINFPPGDGTIHIHTHESVVCNNEEAQRASVEWLYFHDNRNRVKIFKGSHVLGPSVNGVVVLVCVVDPTIKTELYEKLRESHAMFYSMPASIKQEFSSDVIMIHYLHGQAQKISMGRYMLENKVTCSRENRDPTNLVTSQTTMKHTIATSEESVGAPMIIFNAGPQGYSLDVWMHTEGQIAGRRPFGISVLIKELSPNCHSVVTMPVSPWFGNITRRINSFPRELPLDIKLKLASLGFYFIDLLHTTVSCCVRCYHCGLIMTRWRDGQYVADVHGFNPAQFNHPADCKDESNMAAQEFYLNESKVVTSGHGRLDDVHHFVTAERLFESLVVGLRFPRPA